MNNLPTPPRVVLSINQMFVPNSRKVNDMQMTNLCEIFEMCKTSSLQKNVVYFSKCSWLPAQKL